MIEKLTAHLIELKEINSYRRVWMFLSGFVVLTIIGIIFAWDFVQQNKVIWLVSSIGLLLSMTWWYWTMRLIRYLIHFKTAEAEILQDIITEIRYIKGEVVKNYAPQETND